MSLSKDEIKVMKDIRDHNDNWRHPPKDYAVLDLLVKRRFVKTIDRQVPNKYWISCYKLTETGVFSLRGY